MSGAVLCAVMCCAALRFAVAKCHTFWLIKLHESAKGSSQTKGSHTVLGNSEVVLTCGPHNHWLLQGKEVEDEDVFHYATNFTAPLFRIKINSIQLKETVEENKKTNDQVLQDRQYQVSACAGLVSLVQSLLLLRVGYCGHCCGPALLVWPLLLVLLGCYSHYCIPALPVWPLLLFLLCQCGHCCWPCSANVATAAGPAWLEWP